MFDDDESFNDENDERAVWPGWRRTGHFGDWPSLPDSVVPRLPGDLFDDEDDGGVAWLGRRRPQFGNQPPRQT